MEKLLLEAVKQNLGKSLFILLALAGLILSVYHIDKANSWIGILVSFAVLLILIFAYHTANSELEVASGKWFSTIETHLRNAAHVSIYLREFDHPDEFASKHRDALLAINQLFVKCILESPDSFRLVAYNETGRSASAALEWFHGKIADARNKKEATSLLDKCIRIVDRQPNANSSTVYVIDKEILLFNHVEESGRARYYVRFLPRSIIPYFLDRGVVQLFEASDE